MAMLGVASLDTRSIRAVTGRAILTVSAQHVRIARCSPTLRETWDPLRFVETAIFFNGPEQFLKQLLPSPITRSTQSLVWSGRQPQLLEWGPLDDVVMGGVSKSSFTVVGDFGRFEGSISTVNNGGFAGCRSRNLSPPLQLAQFNGLRLLTRGDGKRYKLIVRDSYAWNGIAWACSFDTTGSEDQSFAEVSVPWSSFVPTLFAKRVPGVVLNPDSITTVQLTLSKFEYDNQLNPAFSPGPFRLDVQSIEAYK